MTRPIAVLLGATEPIVARAVMQRGLGSSGALLADTLIWFPRRKPAKKQGGKRKARRWRAFRYLSKPGVCGGWGQPPHFLINCEV